jgi:MYXO-CTERM domain-containing protein
MKSSLFWVALATALVVTRPSQAELLWWGDPSKGTMVFKNFGGDGNCGAGTISTLADPTHGMVFKYDKPAQSNRCENHGIRINGEPYVFQNNATYYLAWYSKLSSTANNNANFQWKSYENHSQNFPIVLKVIGGQMSLMYTPPGGGSSILWRRALMADTWHHYVLGIKTSAEIRGGTIEFWFDGAKQMLSGAESYAGRTFDSKNCPKWGVYGGRGTPMTNLVADLRIATTYQEVAMGSAKPGGSPAGARTDAGGGPTDAGTNGGDASAAPDASPRPSVDSGGSGPIGTGGAAGGNGSGGGGGGGGGGGSGKAGAPSPMGTGAVGSAEATPSPARQSGGCQLAGDRPLHDEPSSGAALGLLALALFALRRRLAEMTVLAAPLPQQGCVSGGEKKAQAAGGSIFSIGSTGTAMPPWSNQRLPGQG